MLFDTCDFDLSKNISRLKALSYLKPVFQQKVVKNIQGILNKDKKLFKLLFKYNTIQKTLSIKTKFAILCSSKV